MTKREKIICESLMNNAIMKALNMKEEYNKYERLKKDGDETTAEMTLRCFDQAYGYADGVYTFLDSLGFKHEKMNTLGQLLFI